MASYDGDISMSSSHEDDAVNDMKDVKSQFDGPPPKKRARLITIDTNSVNQASLKNYLKSQSYLTVSSADDEANISNAEKKNLNDENTDGEIIDDELHELQEESPKGNAANDNIEIAENPIVSGTSIEVNLEKTVIRGVKLKEMTDSCSQEFYIFIDDCLQLISNPEHKKILHEKLPIVKSYYQIAKKASFDEAKFLEIIRNCSNKIARDSTSVLICYTEVYKWLKSKCECVTTSPKTDHQKESGINRLDKALTKIRRKIRHLEKMELEWDDSEKDDTVYVLHSRYNERATHLYNKLCKLCGENPNYGRLTHMRLDFSYSDYFIINAAINRKYQNNSQCPTYYEFDKFLRSCVERHNLGISEKVLKHEIMQCFNKLGELLQQRRQLESYQFQQDLLESSKDPAFENPEIAETIQANRNIYDNKLNQIYEKYSRLQELPSADPQLSSDSDDSHYESNEEEENQEVEN